MMKRIFILVLLSVAVTAGFAQQRKTAFRMTTETVSPGDTVRIVYDPGTAGYGDSLPVRAYMYTYKNFKWSGMDFPIQKTDSGWTGTHILEDSTAMLAWRFRIGDSVDNGKRFPYMILIHDEKAQKMASGAYTEYALIRRKDITGKLSPLANPASLVEPVVLTLWLPKEWNDLYVRRNRFVDVATGLRIAYGAKADSVLKEGAKAIAALPDVTEKELLSLKTAYERVFQDYKGADSIKKMVLAKYPDGLAYRLSQVWDLYVSRTDSLRSVRWNAFQKRFPASRYPYADYLDPNYGDAHTFIIVLQNQANMYFKQHKWAELNKLFADCPFWMLEYSYTHYIDYALRLDEPPLSMKELMTLAGSIMDTIAVRVQSPDEYRSGRGLYAPGEWKIIAAQENAGIYAFHAKLLAKEGRYKEAIKYAEMAKPYVPATDVTFNNTYTKVLSKLGRGQEALPFIRKAIYAGAFTPEMIEILQKDYVHQHGSDKGFADYVTSLKSKENVEKEHEEIRKAMVNLPATMFKLKNMKGEDVDLAQQKGKIVVIDFWATWCYYCKLAMPGMQMAVNKYEKDKDVKFYFIATMEENPAYKKMIVDFIKAKKYTFNVLYDGTGASGKMDAAYSGFASTLKSSGIPLKVIIDQDGKIRWANLGGSANHIAIADEVSYVIELLKKERS